MIHPDVAFAKIRSGKPLTKSLVREVSTWELSTEADKLIAWCLLFLNQNDYFQKIVRKLSQILLSGDSKAITNTLVVLMYASNELLLSPPLKKAVKHAFLTGGASTRINATRILALQKDLGDVTAKKLLKQAINDPDPRVRDNAAIL